MQTRANKILVVYQTAPGKWELRSGTLVDRQERSERTGSLLIDLGAGPWRFQDADVYGASSRKTAALDCLYRNRAGYRRAS